MATVIGRIEALNRYPVKSMRGEALQTAELGWYGIADDRRFALRRVNERILFPWLSAGRCPELMNFTPVRRDAGEGPPTHVRTPAGEELPIYSPKLAAEIARMHGAPVEMMQLKHGVFDETNLSVITSTTAGEICRLAGAAPDVRRFRANVVVRSEAPVPFEEDAWVGGTLSFGESPDAPAVAVIARDMRCVMLNLDPDGGPANPGMMKAVVKVHENTAGVYGTVTRTGRLRVGDVAVLRR